MTPYRPAYKTHSGSIVTAFWLCMTYSIKHLGWIRFTFTLHDSKKVSDMFAWKAVHSKTHYMLK